MGDQEIGLTRVAGMGLKDKEWGGHLEVEDQGLVEGMNVLVSSIQPWILKHKRTESLFYLFFHFQL